MKHYIAVIDKDSDSSYGAVFPDVPGCYGAGDTLDEVIQNATEALRLHAEHAKSDMQEPRTLEEVVEDKEFSEGLNNVTYAAIPLLVDKGRTVRINFTIDQGLLESVDQAAKDRGLTRSAFIAQAAREKNLCIKNDPSQINEKGRVREEVKRPLGNAGNAWTNPRDPRQERESNLALLEILFFRNWSWSENRSRIRFIQHFGMIFPARSQQMHRPRKILQELLQHYAHDHTGQNTRGSRSTSDRTIRITIAGCRDRKTFKITGMKIIHRPDGRRRWI